ncbi:MAG: PDDEXK nuclease domain-containing protein [Prolixibacteraceae bacterium]|nr:PDDEXK nuclease domain-containing protein [Prolixibacteraceae bacterium]
MQFDETYKNWLIFLKDRIRSAQLKAATSVNKEMIMLYWDIGKSIIEKQKEHKWGSKIVDNLSKDLKNEFQHTNGFSRTNLFAMRKFYLFYKDYSFEIVHQIGEQSAKTPLVHQPGGQLPPHSILCKIPWRHHVLILSNIQSCNDAIFYMEQTIRNNWSRNVLELQIDSKLIERSGKALNNFELTLPKPMSDLANETLKDPYTFDFLTLESNVQEIELEKQLIDNITKFLLELGKGFAFVGRQYPLVVGNKERKIDLLFYHTKMHCYVVIDLKTGDFEPEHAGKMNFYLSAVDDMLKSNVDNPTIGVILCKSKNKFDVEYSLQDMNKPLGVSEFTFKELPESIKSNMPTVSELENELKKLL